MTINSVPNVDETLRAYLEALRADDYNAMYARLSKVSQDANPLENFAVRNRDALNTMSAGSFDYEVLSSLVNPYSAEVAYRLTYHTALVGDIQRDMVARFSLENGEWKLNWDDGIILPELAGGNVLRMDYSVPSRGNIYDRDGDVLAAQTTAYAFEIIPGNVTEESMGTLLSEVWNLCGISQEALAQEIVNTPGQFPISLCQASEQESERIRSISPGGLQWTEYNSRYYFEQGVGSHVVGYTQLIPAEEIEEYKRLGYAGDELVGRQGIERWAENYLSGKHGGTLYVVNPSTGQIVTKVGAVDVTTARDLSLLARELLGDRARDEAAATRTTFPRVANAASVAMATGTRDLTFLLADPERRLLRGIAARLPRWITSNHLTLVGVLGAVAAGTAYGLSALDVRWLWAASGALVVNWFGDSLDGTLARVRRTERPRYGYYLDHLVDAFATAVVGVGIGLSPFVELEVALLLVVAYLALSINVYLETAVFGVFRLGYGRIGPTEARIMLIVLNTFAWMSWVWSGASPGMVALSNAAVLLLAGAMGVTLLARFIGNLSHLARLEPLQRS